MEDNFKAGDLVQLKAITINNPTMVVEAESSSVGYLHLVWFSNDTRDFKRVELPGICLIKAT